MHRLGIDMFGIHGHSSVYNMKIYVYNVYRYTPVVLCCNSKSFFRTIITPSLSNHSDPPNLAWYVPGHISESRGGLLPWSFSTVEKTLSKAGAPETRWKPRKIWPRNLHAGTSALLVSRSQSNKGEGRKPLEASCHWQSTMNLRVPGFL